MYSNTVELLQTRPVVTTGLCVVLRRAVMKRGIFARSFLIALAAAGVGLCSHLPKDRPPMETSSGQWWIRKVPP